MNILCLTISIILGFSGGFTTAFLLNLINSKGINNKDN